VRVVLFFLTLLFIGCNQPQIKHIMGSTPNWVQTIQDGEKIDKPGYRCYQTEIKAYSQQEAQKKVTKDIYQQIANEIRVNVSTNTKSEAYSTKDGYHKSFMQTTSLSSFVDISGVYIPYRYYDNVENKAYGYVCLSEIQFQDLQKENNQKYKEYISLSEKLQNAINRGDRDEAKNLLILIQTKFPNIKNTKEFKKFKQEVDNLAVIRISMKNRYYLKQALETKIFSNKLLYLSVIINHNGTYKLVLDNKLIEPNVDNNIVLVKRLLSFYKGKNKLYFYFSKTPLNLKNYVLNKQNINFEEVENFINQFQNYHFFKEYKKDIEVLSNDNFVVCLKKDIQGVWANKIYRLFVDVASNQFKLQCPAKYNLVFKYRDNVKNDKIFISSILVLKKENQEIDEEEYSDMFYKSQKSAIDDYIIPNIIQNLNSIKEFF